MEIKSSMVVESRVPEKTDTKSLKGFIILIGKQGLQLCYLLQKVTIPFGLQMVKP